MNRSPLVSSEVRAAFDRGVRHFTAGRIEQALEAFRETYERRPHPAVAVTIATCLDRLGRAPEAYAEYGRYLRLGADEVDPGRRRAVESAMERLRPRVGFLVIAPPGPGVPVTVDGAHVDLGAAPVVVEPGRHVVAPEMLDGHLAGVTVDLAGGESRDVKLRFPPAVPPGKIGVDDPTPRAVPVALLEARPEHERAIDMMLSAPLAEWVPKRGRWLAPVVLALVFGTGALAGATWAFWHVTHTGVVGAPAPEVRRVEVQDREPEPDAERPRVAAQEPVPAPANPSGQPPSSEGPAPGPAPGSDREPAPHRTPPRQPPETPATLVEVEVSSDPPGALVTSGGQAQGTTPITLFLSTGRASIVSFELQGHARRTVRWSSAGGRRAIHVVLERSEPVDP
ncbi:MAG: hypothetical protein HYY06_07445 [Deltaproteobacteria bacterium]|nr:hypothetical protein [Deltaproteobacteria bacterium]